MTDPTTTPSEGPQNEALADQEAPDGWRDDSAQPDDAAKNSIKKFNLKNPMDVVNSLVENSFRPKNIEQELEAPIPEDIFSLIYLCEAWGWAFCYALLTYACQISIIVLILFDLIDSDNGHNPLKVPPGVPLEVTIAQGASMVLAVSTQTNLLVALSRMSLASSYDHEYVTSIYPNATKASYHASFMLQLIAGLVMLVVSFILNMQSTTVLSLMLNFAALAFISEIQQTAFWIANNGYISVIIQEETQLVTNFSIPKQHRKHSNYLVKRLFFVLIVIILLVFYAILARRQRSGHFICNNLVVQFGDEFRPDLAFYSGAFVQKRSKLLADRAIYEDVKGKGARFAYCRKEKVWAFTGPFDVESYRVVNGSLSPPMMNQDPCSYWLKSPETEAYDILETNPSSWLVVDYFTNQTLPVEHFVMVCNDCEGARASQSCGGHGTCISNECQCDEGRVGINCEHPTPCARMELDLRTEPFPYAEGGKFIPATSYELLTDNQSRPVMVYNKPVYVAFLTSTGTVLNILMFTGRRWGLFLNFEFLDATAAQQLRPGLPSYLPIDFHSWFSRHRVYFFTEPMDLGSPSDSSSPIDLQWYRSRELLHLENRTLFRVDTNQPTNTVLLCPFCRVVYNNCLNEGDCSIDDPGNGNLYDFVNREGLCVCKYGFTGYLCEKELSCFSSDADCLNNGNCTLAGDCECPARFTGKLCQYEIEDKLVDVFS